MLDSKSAALVVIDVQGKLLPFIHEHEETVAAIVRLIKGFRIVGAPILVTEQYRKGLGETAPEIQEAIREADPNSGEKHTFEPLEKMSFSCMLDDGIRSAIEETRRKQIVLCGIESHVCVYQTAMHLLEAGFVVEVVADAVSSRTPRNRNISLQRMRDEGVGITCVETCVFEMLEVCGTDPFRKWVKVIR
jgi:nicotinamidase-related amidase